MSVHAYTGFFVCIVCVTRNVDDLLKLEARQGMFQISVPAYNYCVFYFFFIFKGVNCLGSVYIFISGLMHMNWRRHPVGPCSLGGICP